MRWITELKSWQVLFILVVPGFVGALLPLEWSASVALVAVPGLLMYGWQWFAVRALLARIPDNRRPNTVAFQIAGAYAVTYFTGFMVSIATFSIDGIFEFIGPFHVAAMFASLYMYWFVSKVTTLVRGDDQAWVRFATFIVFSPLAIWRTQGVVSEVRV
ncbi:MAG: hypothetical protein AB8H86_24095 [Polyangiales bacterium]